MELRVTLVDTGCWGVCASVGPQRKTAESINSKLQLVMKSGKACLGYKQVLKTLRNGDGALGSVLCRRCGSGSHGRCPVVPSLGLRLYLSICRRPCMRCVLACGGRLLAIVSGGRLTVGVVVVYSQAGHHCQQLPTPAQVRD
jgi:hypothetical protein